MNIHHRYLSIKSLKERYIKQFAFQQFKGHGLPFSRYLLFNVTDKDRLENAATFSDFKTVSGS